jgi:aspartyl-tRNA(Asn)/glutamyl-tRNA(Gln) amidotransferase subunit B
MRLEANLSLAKITNNKSQITNLPDYKVELKNINSFRFLKKALEVEIERQTELLSEGKKIMQETRGFDQVKNRTFLQRSKEEAQDYRYFPEPDLPPIKINSRDLEALRKTLPELPFEKRNRLIKEFNFSYEYAYILTENIARANYFEESLRLGQEQNISAGEIAKLMINQNLDKNYPEPAGLISHLIEISKTQYASESEAEKAVLEVLKSNPKAVADYQSGNANVLGFLIGQTQKILKGRGEITFIRQILTRKLGDQK